MPAIPGMQSMKVSRLWNGNSSKKVLREEYNAANEQEEGESLARESQTESPQKRQSIREALKDRRNISDKREGEASTSAKAVWSRNGKEKGSFERHKPALPPRNSFKKEDITILPTSDNGSFSQIDSDMSKSEGILRSKIPFRRAESSSSLPRSHVGNSKSSMAPIKSRLNAIGTSLARSNTTQDMQSLKSTDVSEYGQEDRSAGKSRANMNWTNNIVNRHRAIVRDRDYLDNHAVEPEGLLSSHPQEISNESNPMHEDDLIVTHHSPINAVPDLPWHNEDKSELQDRAQSNRPVSDIAWQNYNGEDIEAPKTWEQFDSRRDSIGIVPSTFTGNTHSSSTHGNPFGTDGELSPASTGNFRSLSPIRKNRMDSRGRLSTEGRSK